MQIIKIRQLLPRLMATLLMATPSLPIMSETQMTW